MGLKTGDLGLQGQISLQPQTMHWSSTGSKQRGGLGADTCFLRTQKRLSLGLNEG